MSEKRCKSCKFWINVCHEQCRLKGDCSSEDAVSNIGWYFLNTYADFGCVWWQEEELDLREQLAECLHDDWAKWANQLLDFGLDSKNGTVVITSGHRKVIRRHAQTKYTELAEAYKDNIRRKADEIIAIFEKWQQKGDSDE